MKCSAVSITLAIALSLLAPVRSARAQCVDADLDGHLDVDLRHDLRARLGLRIERPRSALELRLAAELGARGRVAFEAGHELDALLDLEAAYRVSGDASLAGMLGLALQARGRLPEAWVALRAFLDGAPPDVRAGLEARVRAALEAIEPQLGGLELTGDFGAHGQLLLAGRMVATLPFEGAIRLPTGHLRLEVRGEGRLARWIEVDLAAGAVAHASASLDTPTLPSLPAGVALGDVGLLFVPPSADADVRLSAELAARARTAFDAGHEVDALADLALAFWLTGDASLEGMLGLALRASGHLPEAWLTMHAFLDLAPPDARASLEARVRAAMGEIEAQLGGVRIAGDFGARAQVVLDGRWVAALPIDGALRLPTGHVRIDVRARGRLAQHLDLDLAPGRVDDVSVTLPEADADLRVPALAVAAGGAVPAPGVPAPSAPGLDPWPFVVVAGGVAVVLVIAGIVASVFNDQLSATLGTLSAGDPAISGLRTNIDVTSAFEWVGYLGAGVGALTAGIIATVVVVTANAGAHADADADVHLDVDTDLDLDGDLRCDDADERQTRRRVRARRAAQTASSSASCSPWIADGGGLGCTLSF